MSETQSATRKLTQYEDLSPTQQEVVDAWGQGVAVLAGAGSGKTTTLVIKCQELVRRNPQARFAAVSFTERSASDLREKLSQRLALNGSSGGLGGHWVMTIHGLCGAIIREYPREAGFDGEETMLTESDARVLWERATEGLWYERLSEPLSQALDRLLQRESRLDLLKLLARARELSSFGALGFLAESDDPTSRDLAQVALAVLDKYDRLKRRRGGLDFNDLERGADRALQVPSISEAFQKKFDLVLVDEFQDTNPLQARIVTRFCRPDLSNLCVVGDPKQSIYRFRDADVSVFEDFCRRLPVSKKLSWNFRSRPQIIEFTNCVCAPLFDASQMGYEPLEAKVKPQEKGDAVERLDLRDPSGLGPWIQGEIARGIPLEKMALLMRRVRGNEKWLKALTAAGIPIAVGSGGLFWEDPRVRELVAFLRWWALPAHAFSGAVFLRAPWVGVSDENLESWLRTDPSLLDSFLSEAHRASLISPIPPSVLLARALAPLRGQSLRPGELLLALLVSDEIEAEMGSAILGLWHRLEEGSSRGLDFHACVLEAVRKMEEGVREKEVPPPRNQGQLSVLTLHSSKGLEFPHVILIDLGKMPRAMPGPMMYWDRHEGTYLVRRDEQGERDKKDPLFSQWDAREKERNLAESKRVFYVALTRAQERLVLVCPELDEKELEKAQNAEKALSADHWRGWVEAGGALPQAQIYPARAHASSAPLRSAPLRGIQKATSLIRPRHSVTEWNLLSRCPRAYEWTYIRPRKGLAQDQVHDQVHEKSDCTGANGGVSKSSEARDLGSEIHRILEVEDRKLQEQLLEELERKSGYSSLSRSILRWVKASPWMKTRHEGVQSWSELAFEVPIEGEVLVGAIDRLAQLEEGHWGLLDFKVTSKVRAAEGLLASYSAQMQLYAYAIGVLEPEAAQNLRSLQLVNFNPSGVLEVEVTPDWTLASRLAQQAREIVQGEQGPPCPGSVCQYCPFECSARAVMD